MENLISRHRNVSILVAVLFAQVLGLAVQLKRSRNEEQTRLIRIWAVELVTPLEKALVRADQTTTGLWRNYLYLRGLRAENRELKRQIEEMRLSQVRLSEDAEQARRLQLLLGFKEKFIAKTIAAQVIGTSGSEQSRSVYIDKGFADGLVADQPVISADGIVGKVLHVYDRHTSTVLLINDQTSGVGVILGKSRLQGILRGTASGELVVDKIMSDESVEAGEPILTSGGDQIFPKGVAVGTVAKVGPGKDLFLIIRVKPAARLSKLEEVLVIIQVETKSPSENQTAGSVRAVDVLAQRLPSVPERAVDATAQPSTEPGKRAAIPSSTSSSAVAADKGRGSLTQPTAEPVGRQREITNVTRSGTATEAAGKLPPQASKNGPSAAAASVRDQAKGKTPPLSSNEASPASSTASDSRAVPDKFSSGQESRMAAQAAHKSAKPAPSRSQPQPAPVEGPPE